MTKRQKAEMIQETLLTLLVILSVRILFIFLLDLTPLADYICKTYENQYYDEYIYAEGKVNEYVLDETSKLIAQGNVPQSLIYFFYENGGMVYVTDEDLTAMCYDESEKNEHNVLGIFRHGNGEYRIYFSNRLGATSCGTLEHEFGHYLDYLFGWYSKNNSFEEIFNEEKENFQKNISSNEHYKTQTEYFAECYSIYLTEGETLKRYCPKTYEIMELLTEQLEIFYNMQN